MEGFLAAVAKSMLSLAGPVARATARRRAKQVADQLDAFTEPTATDAARASRELRSALLEKEITQGQMIKIMAFVQSEAGSLFIQLVAINTLASRNLRRSVDEALNQQAETLLRLHDPKGKEYAKVAGPILRESVATAVRVVIAQVSRLASDVEIQIRSAAESLSRVRELVDARSIERPEGDLGLLFEKLPSNLEAEAVGYARALSQETELLAIPSIGREQIVALEEAFVPPRWETEGQWDGPSSGTSNPIIAALGTTPRMVLLGDPGGGKSTSVQHALYSLSSLIAEQGVVDAVPFRVVLRHLAVAVANDPSASILEFLLAGVQEYEPAFSEVTLNYILRSGRGVVLFDGLDEILALDLRKLIAGKISKLASAFPRMYFVITSRAVGYDEARVKGIDLELALQPFDENAVANFAGWFFEADEMARARSVTADNFLNQSETIADIRSNPLMLGVLCNLFASGRTMPSNRDRPLQEVRSDALRGLGRQAWSHCVRLRSGSSGVRSPRVGPYRFSARI